MAEPKNKTCNTILDVLDAHAQEQQADADLSRRAWVQYCKQQLDRVAELEVEVAELKAQLAVSSAAPLAAKE